MLDIGQIDRGELASFGGHLDPDGIFSRGNTEGKSWIFFGLEKLPD